MNPYGTATPSTEPLPPVPGPQRSKHKARNRTLGGIGAVLALGLGIAIGASTSTTTIKTVAGPTVTQTATVAGPTPTVTQTAHVKVTQTVNVPPPALTVATYHGQGSWNSPQFSLSGAPVTVKFSYWNNSSGFGGDNFIADITDGNVDDLSFANEIATSGGKTTTLYPSGSGLYHLEVQATGPWSVTITQQ